MSETPSETPTETAPEATQPEQQPSEETSKPKKVTLEDSLSDLDPSVREFVIGEVRSARGEAKNLRDRLKEAEPKLSEYDRLVEASKSDLERANEAAQRWQTEAEQWRKTSVSSRIQALASSDFADPSDAVTGLSANNYLDAGGVINDDAIKRDLADMLAKKPHYRKASQAAEPAKPRVPAPNQHQGSGGGTPALDARQQFAQILKSTLPQPS